MNNENENDESFLLATSFGELSIGEYFDFLGERYKKISEIRATNLDRQFDWLFKTDTEINQ